MTTNCFFCNQQLATNAQRTPGMDACEYNCNKCGKYKITNTFMVSLGQISKEEKARIAAVLYERKDKSQSAAIIDTRLPNSPSPSFTIQELLAQFPKRIDEKLNKALQNLGKLSHYLGEPIKADLSFQPILYALNTGEFSAILNALQDSGYIKHSWSNTISAEIVEITPKGYERIYELGKVNPTSHQAFVAMWFDPSLDSAYKNGFEEAIKKAGYEPLLIKNKEFLGKIDDEIIAGIKRSKFLVADFTGQRGGVYYEAGFAHGLGIPVIYTCRHDHIDKCHFDTNHYNHIVWKDEADLYTQLYNRIRATIGQGPKTK